jgi:hypothetical protein
VAPTITTPPASRTVTAGNTTTFTVAAAGTAPLSYEWRYNNVAIAGATGASYTLNNVQPSNAGNYTVIVSNPYGSASTIPAILTVTPQGIVPSVISAPSSQNANRGSPVIFTVVAAGSAPLTYEWRFNNVALVGATDSSLALSKVQPSDAGTYVVTITNAYGATASSPAILLVAGPRDAPTIVTSPSARSILAGTSTTFDVFASGTTPLNYQWRFNNGLITGATNNSFTLNNAQANNAGNYTVTVTNPYGSASTTPAVLSVTPLGVAPTITTPPASRTVTAGNATTFTVVAAGTAPLGYEWRYNNVAIAGEVTKPNALVTWTV